MAQITKELLIKIETEVEKTLVKVGEKFGVTIKHNGGMYGGNEGAIKLKLTALDTAGKEVDVMREDWLERAKYYGVNSAWLDKTFTEGKYTYTIVGLLPKRRRCPIALVRNDGQKLSGSTEWVQVRMTGKTAAEFVAEQKAVQK